MSTDITSQEFRQALPAPPPKSASGHLRRLAVSFWLNWYFLHIRYAPWLARGTKWIYLWFALCFSHQINRSTGANARRILGESCTAAHERRLARGVLSSFFEFIYDIGQSLRKSPQEMRAKIEAIEGAEEYKRTRVLGKGAIVVTAHMGSFEVGLAALKDQESRIHVVFKRDTMARFEEIRQTLRRRLGVIEAPIDEGWTVWMRLRDALVNNEVVVVQGDRVMPGQKGQAVPFFSGHTLLPTGPIKLAIASGAPLVPIFSLRTRRGKIKLMIEEAIWVDPKAEPVNGIHPALLQLAKLIEKHVGANPEQWLVLEHAFCEDMEDRKKGDGT